MFFTAGPAIRQAPVKSGLTILLAAATLWFGGVTGMSAAMAKGPATESLLPVIKVDALPTQAVNTLLLIRQGGPFPYSKDGSVFGNRERVLPGAPRRYYREYTVQTVGTRSRGARRIVCGGLEVKLPDACFYTDDHYASFRRIAQ